MLVYSEILLLDYFFHFASVLIVCYFNMISAQWIIVQALDPGLYNYVSKVFDRLSNQHLCIQRQRSPCCRNKETCSAIWCESLTFSQTGRQWFPGWAQIGQWCWLSRLEVLQPMAKYKASCKSHEPRTKRDKQQAIHILPLHSRHTWRDAAWYNHVTWYDLNKRLTLYCFFISFQTYITFLFSSILLLVYKR